MFHVLKLITCFVHAHFSVIGGLLLVLYDLKNARENILQQISINIPNEQTNIFDTRLIVVFTVQCLCSDEQNSAYA